MTCCPQLIIHSPLIAYLVHIQRLIQVEGTSNSLVFFYPCRGQSIHNLYFTFMSKPLKCHNRWELMDVLLLSQLIIHSLLTHYVVQIRSTHEHHMRILDDITCPWMKIMTNSETLMLLDERLFMNYTVYAI